MFGWVVVCYDYGCGVVKQGMVDYFMGVDGCCIDGVGEQFFVCYCLVVCVQEQDGEYFVWM